MTKQQQIAYEKFKKALELQEQGISRHDIFSIIGYASLDSLTKIMRKHGYTYDDAEGKYIKKDCNTVCNTKGITNEVAIVQTELVPAKVHSIGNELLTYIESEQDVLVEMINWFKNYSNTCSTSNTLIKIELPESENTMISTRSNKIVWEQFKNFAKKNSPYFTMGDLVAQAFLEYMKKYDS